MSYLALALHCEGSTDRRFLEPLIRRVLIQFVGRRCITPVDVAEQFFDLAATSREVQSVVERITEAAAAVDLVFVHADGGNDSDRVRRELFSPIDIAIRDRHRAEELGLVAVIPVRETEAWVLADADAIRRAFGTTRLYNELGLPVRARDVEHVRDPKEVMTQAHRAARGLRQGRRVNQKYPAFLALIGEQIDLTRLDQVPAFRQFARDLEDAVIQIMPFAFEGQG